MRAALCRWVTPTLLFSLFRLEHHGPSKQDPLSFPGDSKQTNILCGGNAARIWCIAVSSLSSIQEWGKEGNSRTDFPISMLLFRLDSALLKYGLSHSQSFLSECFFFIPPGIMFSEPKIHSIVRKGMVGHFSRQTVYDCHDIATNKSSNATNDCIYSNSF